MGKRIFVCIAAVVTAADDPALVDDHAADGDFAQCVGFRSLLQCLFHIFFLNVFDGSHGAYTSA